jgi:hypothetical protein
MSDEQKTLQEAMEEALSKHPHLRAISEFVDKEISTHVRDGKMSLQEAMARLRALSEDSTFNALVQRDDKAGELDPPDLLYQEDDTHQPGLNPLLLGSILERLQFDGDVPELRSEHMLDGGTPAVPVVSDAVSPVVLGMMLTQASDEVAGEFEENARRLASQVQHDWLALEDKSDGKDGALVEVEKDQIPSVVYERPEVDPEGYKRGEMAALRKVDRPDGSALIKMSDKDRHEMAWKAISTTQGRRSSVHPIAAHILAGLEREGLQVRMSKQRKNTLPLASHTWTIHLDGPQATQTGFAPIAVAREVLLKRLLETLPDGERESRMYLQILTVDDYSQRRVGWSAELHLGAWK